MKKIYNFDNMMIISRYLFNQNASVWAKNSRFPIFLRSSITLSVILVPKGQIEPPKMATLSLYDVESVKGDGG